MRVRAAPATPIADHGLIGDLRTAALVATDGTIDWFCPGRFDAPSVFASILDPDGGSWRLGPDDPEARSQQYYHPETNILVTRFMTEHGVVEVQDFMPVLRAHDPDHRQRLVRRVVGLRGSVDLTMHMAPRPDYAATDPDLSVEDGVVRFADGDLHLALSSTVDLDVADDRGDRAAGAGHRRVRALRARGPGAGRAGPGVRPVGRLRALRGHGRLLAGLARAVDLHRAVARVGGPLGAHPQAAVPRAHRRHRRGPHHQPPREHRRQPQLGLPLRVGPRRRVQRLRPAPPRLHRRGGGVRPLPVRAARRGGRRCGRRARPAARALRPRRRPAARAGARPPRRLPRLPPRAGRQRRGRPAAARRLRRDRRLGLPLRQARPRHQPRRVERPARASSRG